jgi:integrase
MRAPAPRSSLGVAALPGDRLAGDRDRTLILIGFAGALRRSELVGIDVEDVTEDESGLRVTIRRSKTDQDAARSNRRHSRTGPARPPARSAPGGPGWPPLASAPAPPSAASTGTAGSAPPG